MHRSLSRAVAVPSLATLLVAQGLVMPAPASAYPPEDAGYLDYAEMVEAIGVIADTHPASVRLFSIGLSHEGRELWAAKVSDNPAMDEDEPEVLFDAGMHAREHLSTEMAVAFLSALATGHGAGDPRTTALVERNEIFIVFSLNPDGSEFDHASGVYQDWRKNRQPTPGTDAIGTDVNRNFAYQWGTNPLNADPLVETYRGPEAWSAPETRAFRDWVESRVVGGEQQIRVHVTLHSFGRVILHPYGYTYAPVGPDMSADDNAVLVAMAAEMARRSGYAAAQSSAWADINVGNQMDWMYAAHRIMTFTFEMGDAFYMPDEAIAPETGRMMDAAFWAIEQAACPYAVVGLGDAHCGAEHVAADREAVAAFLDRSYRPYGVEHTSATAAPMLVGCLVGAQGAGR